MLQSEVKWEANLHREGMAQHDEHLRGVLAEAAEMPEESLHLPRLPSRESVTMTLRTTRLSCGGVVVAGAAASLPFFRGWTPRQLQDGTSLGERLSYSLYLQLATRQTD